MAEPREKTKQDREEERDERFTYEEGQLEVVEQPEGKGRAPREG